MSKVQKLNFQSVDEFLEFLPKGELNLVLYLRSIVFDCIPRVREKLAYNVPFYYLKKRISFIWPSAVPWGGIKSGVMFGLCKGAYLSNPLNYFDIGNRKEISTKVFHNIDEVEVDRIKDAIFEAVELDMGDYNK